MVLGQLDIHMQKMKLDSYLKSYVKINSKWIKDLNVRAKIIKLLEGINLCDLGLDNGFWDMTPKAQATKEKIGDLDLIKIKNFCTSKVTIKKMKRQGWPGGAAVKFPLSASAAWGLPVRILGADTVPLGKPCCGRRPTYKVEEDGHGC
uniref:Uncharacterized protein n=1 Tax=Equus caballus TaxID=9796 RepID=A0A9L0TL14_HORSE